MTDLKCIFQGVEDGTITKHLMSEDAPEDNTGDVFILVGKNYEETVYHPDKDGTHFLSLFFLYFLKLFTFSTR